MCLAYEHLVQVELRMFSVQNIANAVDSNPENPQFAAMKLYPKPHVLR